MAFASGPVSFQRFAISGRLPQDVTEAFVTALNRRAFGKVAVQSDQTQAGWVGAGHLFETELAAEQIACGRFAHLALRIDRLKPPANLVRAYIRLEEEAALAASGREFLGKTERRKARETALQRAEEEARAGTFRRMNAYPVLLDLERRACYLSSLGNAVADQLLLIFHETFGASLEPLDPGPLAARVFERGRRVRELEALAPITLVHPPEGYRQGPDADGDLGFLGKELLTWLWYRSEVEDGPVHLPAGEDVTATFDQTLRLVCPFGLTGSAVLTADGPTRLPEARAALASGKQPAKAGLVLGTSLGEVRLTLDGKSLRVSRLILPEPDEPRDPQARLEQRFEAIADTAAIVDALFEMFLLRRTGREWEDDLRAMSAWATGKGGQKRLRAVLA